MIWSSNTLTVRRLYLKIISYRAHREPQVLRTLPCLVRVMEDLRCQAVEIVRLLTRHPALVLLAEVSILFMFTAKGVTCLRLRHSMVTYIHR